MQAEYRGFPVFSSSDAVGSMISGLLESVMAGIDSVGLCEDCECDAVTPDNFTMLSIKEISSAGLRLIWLALIVLAGSAHAEFRQWVTARGESVKGELQRVANGKVVLLREDNRRLVAIEYDHLSRTDQLWIDVWEKKQVEAGREVLFEESLTGKWPAQRIGGARVNVVTEPVVEDRNGNKRYNYRTDHFRFISDLQLTQGLVSEFAGLFENTYEACKRLPLGMRMNQVNGKKLARYPIYLFGDVRNYLMSGGPAGSAGVYIPRADAILIPLESLGVMKKGARYTFDRGGESSTLVHEVVHQLSGSLLRSRPWFTEGLAEYFTAAPVQNHWFDLRRMDRAVPEYLLRVPQRGASGRGFQAEVNLPGFQRFVTMPHSGFVADISSGGRVTNINYGAALMWVHYFAHHDGAGDAAALKDYLRVVAAKGDGQEAFAALLADRTPEVIERDFKIAWRRMGITVNFVK